MRLFIYSTTTIYTHTSIYGSSDETQHGGSRATASVGGILAPVLDMGTAAAVRAIVPFWCDNAPSFYPTHGSIYTSIAVRHDETQRLTLTLNP